MNSKANKDTLYQEKINPFKMMHDEKSITNIKVIPIPSYNCSEFYIDYGICWFRSVMQIVVYLKWDIHCSNVILSSFLEEFYKVFELDTNCYNVSYESHESDESLNFHTTNLYAYIIYLLYIQEKKGKNDKMVRNIYKHYAWYTLLFRKNVYASLHGLMYPDISTSTRRLLQYLINYTDLDENISTSHTNNKRLCEYKNNTNHAIKIVSYIRKYISISTRDVKFRNLLLFFMKSNRVHNIEQLYCNIVALHLKDENDKYYQLVAMTIGNHDIFNISGHILSIMEDKTLKFPMFSGTEVPKFNLATSLAFDLGVTNSSWNGHYSFNYDLGFRECFYKECKKDDVDAYDAYLYIIKIIRASPDFHPNVYDYAGRANKYFEFKKTGFVLKEAVTLEYENYIRLINSELSKHLFGIELQGAITKFIENKLITNIERGKEEYYDRLYFKQRPVLTKCRIKELLDIVYENKDEKNTIYVNLRKLLNEIPHTIKYADGLMFAVDVIQKNIPFETMLFWLDTFVGAGASESKSDNNKCVARLNHLLYIVPMNFNANASDYFDRVVSVFDLFLLFGFYEKDDYIKNLDIDIDENVKAKILRGIELCRKIKIIHSSVMEKQKNAAPGTYEMFKIDDSLVKEFKKFIGDDDNEITLEGPQLILKYPIKVDDHNVMQRVVFYLVNSVNNYTYNYDIVTIFQNGGFRKNKKCTNLKMKFRKRNK